MLCKHFLASFFVNKALTSLAKLLETARSIQNAKVQRTHGGNSVLQYGFAPFQACYMQNDVILELHFLLLYLNVLYFYFYFYYVGGIL
jgi:hypothetical protein